MVSLLVLVAMVGAFVMASRSASAGLPLPTPGELRRHAEAGHRFFCPACLRFSAFRLACPHCNAVVRLVSPLSAGATTAACPECARPVAFRPEGEAEALRAHCECCG